MSEKDKKNEALDGKGEPRCPECGGPLKCHYEEGRIVAVEPCFFCESVYEVH